MSLIHLAAVELAERLAPMGMLVIEDGDDVAVTFGEVVSDDHLSVRLRRAAKPHSTAADGERGALQGEGRRFHRGFWCGSANATDGRKIPILRDAQDGYLYLNCKSAKFTR